MTFEKINEILARYPEKKGNLISILHEVQSEFNYLPEDALRYISRRLDIPITRLYAIATFYHFFSLTPKGRHTANVCLGTACHVKGSERVLRAVELALDVMEGGTTTDMRFTVGAVRCVGACSLAPVMVIDKDTHGKVNPKQVPKILNKYE
jgi:NADH:ubiquinone oxidoreductase subunit E